MGEANFYYFTCLKARKRELTYAKKKKKKVVRMASQSTGIQQLLVAEKKAAEKVSDARKRKAKRLKQAKEEAQAEIEKYRQQRETAYKDHEAQHMGSRGDLQAKIDQNTQAKLREIDVNMGANKDAVLRNLLQLVMDVTPELHVNQKLALERENA